VVATVDTPGYPVGSEISATIRPAHGHYYSGYFGGYWVDYPQSLEVVVYSGGDSHESCSSWTGFCSTTINATGTYSADYTIQYSNGEVSTVTASSSGLATVNFNEGDKVVDPSALPTFPTPHGGTIYGQSYTISDDNPDVETTLVGSAVHASTEVMGTAAAPWFATETGSGVASEGDVDIPIATSTLVAPNNDTVWSVTDDHLQVTTSMAGADVFASGLPAPVGTGNPFNYTVSATGTETSDQYSDQSFNWTMNGSATESWQEPGQVWTGTAYGYGGVGYYSGGSYATTETKSHTVAAPSPGVIEGFTRTSESLYNAVILSEYINSSGELIVVIRYSGTTTCPGYVPCYASNGSATVNYDLTGYNQHNDPLTVTQSGSATVNAMELDKVVATGVAEIVPLNGGTLVGETYSVTDDNPLVQAWKSGTDIVARTAVFGSATSPWSGSESGAAWVSPADGLKLIGTTSLSAPNSDEVLSISDDNANVITLLSGTSIYAQAENDGDGISDSVDTDPLAFTDDFDDGTTTGSIVTRGDQSLEITDAIDPGAGVLVTALVGGGATPAEVSVSGGAGSVLLDAGESVILTTSSAGIEVIVGPVDAVLVGVDGTVATVTVPAGNELVFDPNTLTVTTPVSNPDTLVITVEGEPGGPDHSVLPGALEVLPSVVPPVVTVPADFSLEATSPDGAVAIFVATAFDDIDGPLVPTCTPASGTELSLGDHTITCEATDSTPLTGYASFVISVVDTTQPVITVPGPVEFENNVPEGATGVDYGSATATDIADPAPVISDNAPATFPLGDTTVIWHAEDASGNFIEDSQTVTVICSPGSYQAPGDSVCTPAPPGSYVPVAGATAATLCAPGTYQPDPGQLACLDSPAGSFVPTSGASVATLCAPGTYQPSTGEIVCIDSPAGSFVPLSGAIVADLCAPGTYQALTGQPVCDAAPAGSFVPTSGASAATLCAPGTYQPAAGEIVCIDSPPGSFVPTSGASDATLCAPGTYQPDPGKIVCIDSPPGSFVPVSGAAVATLCAPGTYQPDPGQMTCLDSPAGSFVPGPGATTVTPCAPGTYQPNPGQIVCLDSPAGSFVPTSGASVATLCAPGTYQPNPGQIVCLDSPAGSFVSTSGASVATLCPPGTYQALTGQPSCDAAPAGSFVPVPGATEAIACAPGTFQALTGQTSCDPAPAGSFVPVSGAATATLCAPGTYQPDTGQLGCIDSPAGSHVPTPGSAFSILCAPGTYQPDHGQSACIDSPAGSFVPVPGATVATLCAPGTYQPATGQIVCEVSPPGSFVPVSGAAVATLCAPGTYQPNPGQIVCLDSPTGSFVSTPGAVAATLCAPGTYQPNPGQIVCLDSPAGSFVPVSGAIVADLCTPGTFQALPGQASCDPAPAGSFVPVSGAATATLCAPGTYQPDTGQIACIASPAGSYVSVFGAAAANLCAPGTYQPDQGQTACLDSPAGSVVPNPGATTATLCVPGTYQPSTGETVCLDAPIGTYVTDFGSTGVVACGIGLTTLAVGSTSSTDCVDITPPEIYMPPDKVVEGNIPGGANVVVDLPTAYDVVDPSPVIWCDKISGAYPLGSFTVNCTATDSSSNVASGSYQITVDDTTPPVIHVPADMQVLATSSAGAIVNFTVTASDIVGIGTGPTCSPASGTQFPIGSTLVSCSVSDTSGNSDGGAFTVVVLGGRSLIQAAYDAILPYSDGNERFRNASNDLGRALPWNLWADEVHADAQLGQQVFSRVRSAVQDLEALLNGNGSKGKNSLSLDLQQIDDIQLSIDNLVTASRILASTAIADADAAATPGNKAARDREAAHEYFAAAESSTKLEDVIHNFRKAWEHAVRAL
jgi:hypothetical protein